MTLITVKEIEQVANLARLQISEEEKKKYAEQLSVIFDYISLLNEVDTSSVEETSQVTGLEDVTREDEAKVSDEKKRQEFIAMFPEKMGNLLKVKAVFDNEEN